MQCIAVQIAPAIPACVTALAGEQGILMRVIQNPTQPGFNHYLFESVAALVKQGCAENPAMVDTLENMLFPPFNYVLSQDVQVMPSYHFSTRVDNVYCKCSQIKVLSALSTRTTCYWHPLSCNVYTLFHFNKTQTIATSSRKCYQDVSSCSTRVQ